MEIINKQPQPKPKPILGICFPQIFLPDHKVPPLKRQDQTPFALLKYFPKNIDSLPDNLSHSNLKTRIKHLKLIKRIPRHHRNNTLRTLFANKRKNVKFAAGVEDQQYGGGYDKYSLELLKMFPNIQKIKFCVEKSFEDEDGYKWQAKQYCLIDKMSRYLRKMASIKYLNLSTDGDFLVRLLSKLNSFEAMLSGLQVFDLYFYDSSSQNFQALLNLPKVVRHLTYFTLNCTPSYVNSLQYLQNFQNLRKLCLYFSKELDTFRNCKFPVSLRNLELCFSKTDWPSLVTFLDELEGLENLEKLEVSFYPTEEGNALQDSIENLLSKILALKEFKMAVRSQGTSQNSSRTFDMSRFLSCVQHLSHSLQRLTFSDVDLQYNFTNLESAGAFHLPELSYLCLEGRGFSSLLVLENALALVQAKPDAPAPDIRFERIKVDSGRSLLELLNTVKKISGKKIELTINYESKGEDDDYFKENYEQVKQSSGNLKNVSLWINWTERWPMRWIKELRSLEKFFGRFWVF